MASLPFSESHPDTKRMAWGMVLFAMAGTMCGTISVLLINTGIFMKPLSEAFGWNRAAITVSLSIGALTMAAANPFAGRLIDRYGVRHVLIVSQLVYGAIVALIPMLVAMMGIYGLYLAFGVASAFGAGATAVPFVRLLSGWFSGPLLKSRGFALGCAAAGVPLGASITGPLAILLTSHFGWQGGFYGISLLPLLIALPISILYIREAPQDHAAVEHDTVLPGLTLAEAARTAPFWMMIAMVLLISSCTQGLSIHITPFLSDSGLGPDGLASITALSGILAIIARLLAGFLFDRFFAPHVAIGNFVLPMAAAVLMSTVAGLPAAIVGAVLLALGQGAESDFIGYIIGRYFGLRHYGRIFGTIYGTFMLGIAVGPFLFGMAYDAWGDYRVPFMIAAVGLGALCILLGRLPRFTDEEPC